MIECEGRRFIVPIVNLLDILDILDILDLVHTVLLFHIPFLPPLVRNQTIITVFVQEHVHQQRKHNGQQHRHPQIPCGRKENRKEHQPTHPYKRKHPVGDGHQVLHQVRRSDVQQHHHNPAHIDVGGEGLGEGGDDTGVEEGEEGVHWGR